MKLPQYHSSHQLWEPSEEQAPANSAESTPPPPLPPREVILTAQHYLNRASYILSLVLFSYLLDPIFALWSSKLGVPYSYSTVLPILAPVLFAVGVAGLWSDTLASYWVHLAARLNLRNRGKLLGLLGMALIVAIISFELVLRVSGLGIKAVLIALGVTAIGAFSTIKSISDQRVRHQQEMEIAATRVEHGNYLQFVRWLVPVLALRVGSAMFALTSFVQTSTDVLQVLITSLLAALITAAQAPKIGNFLASCRGCSVTQPRAQLKFSLCSTCAKNSRLRWLPDYVRAELDAFYSESSGADERD